MTKQLSDSLLKSLKDRALTVIETRNRLLGCYRNGEDDPMTDGFKGAHMACTAAERSLAETATPEIILEMAEQLIEPEQDIKQCDCCGQMKPGVSRCSTIGIETFACEDCRNPQ